MRILQTYYLARKPDEKLEGAAKMQLLADAAQLGLSPDNTICPDRVAESDQLIFISSLCVLRVEEHHKRTGLTKFSFIIQERWG